MYAPLDYDPDKFVRCPRCGVLKRRTNKRPISPQDRAKVLVLHNQGLGRRAISRLTGTHRCTVQRVVKRHKAEMGL